MRRDVCCEHELETELPGDVGCYEAFIYDKRRLKCKIYHAVHPVQSFCKSDTLGLTQMVYRALTSPRPHVGSPAECSYLSTRVAAKARLSHIRAAADACTSLIELSADHEATHLQSCSLMLDWGSLLELYTPQPLQSRSTHSLPKVFQVQESRPTLIQHHPQGNTWGVATTHATRDGKVNQNSRLGDPCFSSYVPGLLQHPAMVPHPTQCTQWY